MANHTDEMRQYREAFSLFDKDHDDIIAPQELGNYKIMTFHFFSISDLHLRRCSSFMWLITIRS
jgi:Ca2+-binding EF-hand superfamily protein